MKLAIEALSKAWGGVRVLDRLSMAVDGEAITGLIGPNGAGKSTLFAAISGIVPADGGSIRFGDTALDPLSPVERARRGLLRTFQVPRPFRNLSVRDNLRVAAPDPEGESLARIFLFPRRVRASEARIARQVDAVIEVLNLQRVAGLAAGRLSGGQLKLLELGRLLMNQPRLILLDEPFAGVNPVLVDELADRIRLLNARGIGFFIVEHDLGALSRLAGRLFAMDRGAVLAQGTPDEVLSDPAVRAAYVGGE